MKYKRFQCHEVTLNQYEWTKYAEVTLPICSLPSIVAPHSFFGSSGSPTPSPTTESSCSPLRCSKSATLAKVSIHKIYTFESIRTILISSTYLAAEASKQNIEPFCYLKCLQTQDYIDLLYTTVSEFPGLFITMWIIELIGRKKTMAVEFIIFSFFVFLINICVTR